MPEAIHDDTDMLEPILRRRLADYQLTTEVETKIKQLLEDYLEQPIAQQSRNHNLHQLRKNLQDAMLAVTKKYQVCVKPTHQVDYQTCYLEYAIQMYMGYNSTIRNLCNVHYQGPLDNNTNISNRLSTVVYDFKHPTDGPSFAHDIHAILHMWEEAIYSIL